MSEAVIICDKVTGRIVEVRTGSPGLPKQLPNVDSARHLEFRVPPNHPAINRQEGWNALGGVLQKKPTGVS